MKCYTSKVGKLNIIMVLDFNFHNLADPHLQLAYFDAITDNVKKNKHTLVVEGGMSEISRIENSHNPKREFADYLLEIGVAKTNKGSKLKAREIGTVIFLYDSKFIEPTTAEDELVSQYVIRHDISISDYYTPCTIFDMERARHRHALRMKLHIDQAGVPRESGEVYKPFLLAA